MRFPSFLQPHLWILASRIYSAVSLMAFSLDHIGHLFLIDISSSGCLGVKHLLGKKKLIISLCCCSACKLEQVPTDHRNPVYN